MRSARYRASTFFTQHRLGVPAAIVVAVAVATGTTVAVWRGQARATQRAKVAERIDEVRAVARSVSTDEVQDALNSLNRLSKEATGHRDLLLELADAYEKLAAFQNAGAQPTSAADAIATQQKAIAIREQIAQLGHHNSADLQALARAYMAMAEFHATSGVPQKALEHLQQATPIAESLLASDASEEVRLLCVAAYVRMARLLGAEGDSSGADTRSALAYLQGALKMQRALAAEFPENIAHQQSLAAIHHTLASTYSAMGEREEGLEQSRKAIAAARRVVDAQPENPSYHRELAVQLGNTGTALMQQKQTGEALNLFREALAHVQKAIDLLNEIVAKDPENTGFRRELALTFLAKSRVQLEVNDPAAAVASAENGTAIAEQLAAATPGDVAVQRTLALLLAQLGHSHAKLAATPNESADSSNWQRAKDAFANALAVYERLRADGKLSGADAKKPEELAREIANCDTALAAHGR